MIQKFLKAKHWQLFILMFAIPFLLQMILMMWMMSTMMSGIENEYMEPDSFFQIFESFGYMLPIIMIFNMIFYFGWFWSIGVGLQKYVPSDVNLKVNRFKFTLIFPLIYITFIAIGISWIFSGIAADPNSFPQSISPLVFLIIPLHFFSMACMFYNLYYVSKTLKTVELQREAKIGECLKEVILFWFYIVGIWILQPQINRIVSGENQSDKNLIDS